MSNSLRNTSVTKLLRILEEVVNADQGIGVSELARNLDMNKSTIYRFLATLEEEGYLEQDNATQHYKEGIKMFELSSRVINKTNWVQDIKPYLSDLQEKVQETVHLGVIDKGEVIYIDKVECDRSIRMYSKVGNRAPVHCTGIGKAILAHIQGEEQENIIESIEMKSFTEKTITNKDRFKRHLKKIRAQGFSIDDEEHEMGIRCAAAPIYNYKNELLGAISVAGPSSRINQDVLIDLSLEVKEASQLISRRLGNV
ncbi:IclR family transcriptional regulator [Bacillus shivajii]|uniref:IclR family transcriptional regulator n=1 Tax=Bacillus shivajii TaxID=1983719 RepID=UPI001CF9912D|nr:IclR family transcriptional regulator [Bacillus shivajii]UCZ52893.1 IclR family transcriptional regulator [Bacillus shivajii]